VTKITARSVRPDSWNLSCKSVGNWHDQPQPANNQREASMMIGKFTQAADGCFEGDIIGLGLKLASITFSPVPAKQGNGPDFVVLETTKTAANTRSAPRGNA
jgi:hypothetical protein